MQTPKPRIGSSEAPQRVSPRAVRQLKATALEVNSASSSQAALTQKNRSPKVAERRSPRSPVPEKKRPNRVSELESQLSQFQQDLKNVKDRLISSESCKKRAQQDAEESKKQLLAVSIKLEESQRQLQALSAPEETRVIELCDLSQELSQASQSKLEAIQKQHSVALASAMNEIQRLKVELETVAESEVAQTKCAESAHAEIQSLKGNLAETHSLLGSMKSQLMESKESELQAEAIVTETLSQLETAKRTIETLKSDGIKATEAYNSIASELNKSRTHANLLEELVSKLKVDFINASNTTGNPAGEFLLGEAITENQKNGESNQLNSEFDSLKFEMEQLRSALETAEISFHEEQIRSTVQLRNAYELLEQVKTASSLREAELEAELKRTKKIIEELKTNLMDKETQLQGILEENEVLNMGLKKNLLYQRECELEAKLKKSKENVADLKADLMDKETELQNIMEENEIMRSEIKRREMDRGNTYNEAAAQLEAARAAEREALMKLGFAMEESEKSNRRATRVAEQLEATQAANSEMEAELRRLKVQSDQWRKAAEAAAAMLSAGNNGKVMERTGSLASNYNHVAGKFGSPCSEDMDDDPLKKRNGNMLKKIGVLWKKPQK
ncbi:interactor of constitutive active ROPs 3 isoform X2 [Malania oleifera]|uniref:interactor of constitutive active ROPs 3 isoform X2 n=1 Tax=Malania oleifera TaxID=397392 RepID=UPI0025ADF38C|nr:interactor of constitutive active ROPs 3 isoform X2 [Malania oleifera]XP_057954789.1 interactor of constitutive active ROPs 3 isoform X2 [Malania oleifera]XP_057954790.1 interactor of constitutive active ROPs 3 isoform X2 [Malania oleifera]XP_057954791.1 interactor of constitutive active ROPs 3 isoform X2 [Malania oleifera]XP_057954792.1 interactor of constitutive active ROPs 3 isoform X2 [Malania oleifera]